MLFILSKTYREGGKIIIALKKILLICFDKVYDLFKRKVDYTVAKRQYCFDSPWLNEDVEIKYSFERKALLF